MIRKDAVRWVAFTMVMLACVTAALATPPSTPISLSLKLTHHDPVTGSGEVLIEVSSTMAAPGTLVEMILPEGMTAETSKWMVDLVPGTPMNFETKWATDPSALKWANVSISARAYRQIGPTTAWSDMESIPLNVDLATGFSQKRWVVDHVPVAGLAEPGDAVILSMTPTPFSFPVSTDPTTAERFPTAGDAQRPGSDPAPPERAATVFLTGTWNYQDRSGVQRAIDQQLLEIRRGDGTRIGGGVFCFTNVDGTFNCGLTHPGTSMRVWVRSWTNLNPGPTRLGAFDGPESAGACASDSIDCTYPVQTGEIFCADGTTCNVGNWFVFNAVEPWGGAHQMTQDLIRSWKMILFDNRHPAGTHSGPGRIDYPVPAGHGTHAHVGNGEVDGWISIESPSQRSGDVVTHEYGHVAMQTMYIGAAPIWPISDCPNPHFIELAGGPGCGLSEGFADFWAWYSNQFYDGDNNGANNGGIWDFPGGGQVDMETRNNGTFDNGDTVEGNVAAAMGDMLDFANDGPATGAADIINDGVQHVWHTTFDQNDNRFSEWWAAYTSFGHDPGPGLATLAHNTIDYGFVLNDVCVRPIRFFNAPFSDVRGTATATTDANDPSPGCGNGSRARSVWYQFVAPANGTIVVDTFGSNYDTILQAYTGSCGAFSPVTGGCNDDISPPARHSEITIPVTVGGVYTFQVTAYFGTAGTVAFNLRYLAPPHDACPAHKVASGYYYTDNEFTGAASADGPSPTCGNGSNGKDAWYRWTAPVSGTLRAHTFGSNYDTILQAYTGGCSFGFTPIPSGCSDDFDPPQRWSQVTFQVTKGMTVFFQVSAYSNDGGALDFTIDFTPDAGLVPDGSVVGEVPLDVFHNGSSDLLLIWGRSCLTTDVDYAVYEGPIGSYYSHYAYYCGTGGGTSTVLTPSSYDTYYLVVPHNYYGEGSYGVDSFGSERPPAVFNCLPQTIGACMPACGHSKCDQGFALDPACDSCAADICAVDPYCCNVFWDSFCVQEVRTICRSLACPESQGTCSHTLCSTGAPLTATCDAPPVSPSCVDAVCAVDPYCCGTAWDVICVGEVSSVCGYNCN